MFKTFLATVGGCYLLFLIAKGYDKHLQSKYQSERDEARHDREEAELARREAQAAEARAEAARGPKAPGHA